jgi:copper chaperone
MAQQTYSVPGISCDNCKSAIEEAVGDLPDVTLVTVDVPAKTVQVAGGASDASIRAAIDEAGYDVADGPHD